MQNQNPARSTGQNPQAGLPGFSGVAATWVALLAGNRLRSLLELQPQHGNRVGGEGVSESGPAML